MTEPQTWKITTTVPAADVAAVEAALTDVLGMENATLSSFEADDKGHVWTVEAYTWTAPDAPAIEQALAPFHAAAQTEPVADQDWVANSLRLLAPVQVGRFFVHGAHDAHRVPPGAIALKIEAGQAFGSGNHETTQGCLAALMWLWPRFRPARVWDVGTGSGILAIAASKLWRQAKVFATDLDPVAVRVARENALENGMALASRPTAKGRLAFAVAAGVHSDAMAEADLLIANILLNPLVDLAPAFADRVRPGGIAVLSGILEKQEAAISAAYGRQGFRLLKRFRHNGWSALILMRS
jgi:ribosomal protein L11 methyltransferase